MILQLPIFLITIPLMIAIGWWLSHRQRPQRGASLLRIATISLLSLALARPIIPGSAGLAPLVIIIDQSSSLTEEAQRQAQQELQQTLALTKRPVELIVIGEQAYPWTTDSLPSDFNPQGSDIAGALRLANGLLPDGGSVIMLSDGGATTAGTLDAAQILAERNIAVDIVPLESIQDIRLDSLRVPSSLRERERFSADAIISSPSAQTVKLVIWSDEQFLASQSIEVQPGRNVVSIRSQAGDPGFHTFRAVIEADNDAQPANNEQTAWTVVGTPPRVLIVERAPDSAALLRDQLEAAGLVTEAIRPNALASQLSELADYDTIVLQDISATSLNLDQQFAIQEFVRSLGHGLVVIGGSNSYSLGEYRGSPLEDVLPMSMEPPPRRERPTVALLLIIDRSASMLGRVGEDKFSLAKAAAIAATDTLGPDDTIGVLTFETNTKWAVTFTKVGTGLALSSIQEQISAIEAGGGTNIYGALEAGLPALQQQPNTVRHAVLFTDGKSPIVQSYEALVTPVRQDGVTLSTIAIGEDADQVLLESLAKLGAGRYHFAAEPADLPRLTLQETEIARQNPLEEGEFSLGLDIPHPAIRGLAVADLPQIEGYIATTLKPEAEALLTAPQGDVVLGAWQYGLGRVVAWTSDANERWTEQWRTFDQTGNIWAQMIASTYPDPADTALRLSSKINGTQATITLDAVNEAGIPIDLADVGLRIVYPDTTEVVIGAEQSGPGMYTAQITLPQTGTYQLLAALEYQGKRLEARSGIVRSYAPELAIQADQNMLEQIASITKGSLQTSLAFSQETEIAPRPERQLWPWFTTLALLLWIIEVALRRGWLERWRWKRGT